MHRTNLCIRLGLVLLLSLFAGSLYATTAATGLDPVAWDQAANGLENSVPLTGWAVVEKPLGDYCDTSSNAGTTASCETNLTVPAAVCAANRIVEKGCRSIGGNCTVPNVGTGKWCKRCYVKCRVKTCAEIDPDSDIDGTGEGDCTDADAMPTEP